MLSRRQVMTGIAAGLSFCHSPLFAADSASLKLRRGVNLHNLLNWPDAKVQGNQTTYAWPAFQSSRFSMADADLRQLVSVGFDFVRLTVDPSIFIEATAGNAAQIQQHAKDVVSQLLRQKLNVVFDLHPVAVNPRYAPANLVRDATSPEFQAYADLVARMALLLRAFPPNRVALEVMNEPLIVGTTSADTLRWQGMLETLHQQARSSNETIPLILSGAQGSDPAALSRLDTGPFQQSNVFYTFHYYEPYAFTHQSMPRIQPQCISDLQWPEQDANVDEAASRAKACVAAANLSDADRAKLALDTDHLFNGYKKRRFGPADTAKALDDVSRWAAGNGIPSSRILMGEFGSVSSETISDQRALWLHTVVQNAERLGFAWAYWAYKGQNGMQLLDPDSGTLDPDTLKALQLHAPA